MIVVIIRSVSSYGK